MGRDDVSFQKYMLVFTIETFCRAMLIFLFVYTALSKLLDVDTFRNALNNQPFANQLTAFLLVFIPAYELIAVLTLILTNKGSLGFIVSGLMMLIFTIYAAAVYFNFFPYVPCSCGGVLAKLSWETHLLLNLFFLLICVWGYFLTKRRLILAKRLHPKLQH
jgi:putative oxidoreductase